MDKFFDVAQSQVPALSSERLEQMTELALSYRQHTPGNENRKAGFFSLRWAGAFAAFACMVIAFGVITFQNVMPVAQPDQKQVAAAVANADDDYEDMTDIALLQTLDSF